MTRPLAALAAVVLALYAAVGQAVIEVGDEKSAPVGQVESSGRVGRKVDRHR